MTSSYAAILPLLVKGAKLKALIRVSVVDENVPLLISARTLQGMGAILDMVAKKYEFRSLGTVVEMKDTTTGHIGFNIVEGKAGAISDWLDADWQPFIQSQREIGLYRSLEDCRSDQNPLQPQLTKGLHKGKGVDQEVVGTRHGVRCVAASTAYVCTQQAGSTLSLSDGGHSGAEEQDSVDRVHQGALEDCRAGPEATASRTTEVDLQGYEANRPSGVAGELAEGLQAGVAGHVGSVRMPVLRHQPNSGDRLSSVGARPDGDGVGGVPAADGEQWGDRAIKHRLAEMPSVRHQAHQKGQSDHSGGISRVLDVSSVQGDSIIDSNRAERSSMPSLRDSIGAPLEPCDEEAILGMQELPSLPGDHGDGGGRGTHDSFGTKVRRWISEAVVRGRWRHERRDDPSSNEESTDQSGTVQRVEPCRRQDEVSGSAEKCEPLSMHEIQSRIRAGRKARRLAKKGTFKRLWGNCKQLAVFACLMTLSATQSACDTSCKFVESVYGSGRPDVVEIFGGHAEVSLQFSRRGWNAMQPVDSVYGDDLRDDSTRSWLKDVVKRTKPRLAVISYPCKLWSLMTNLNYTTPQQKRRLAKLRKS